MRVRTTEGCVSQIDYDAMILNLQAENSRLRGECNQRASVLMEVAHAFKRGTPLNHAFCECDKCEAIYTAFRKIVVYDLPSRSADVH
jgi:hypothetical protein